MGKIISFDRRSSTVASDLQETVDMFIDREQALGDLCRDLDGVIAGILDDGKFPGGLDFVMTPESGSEVIDSFTMGDYMLHPCYTADAEEGVYALWADVMFLDEGQAAVNAVLCREDDDGLVYNYDVARHEWAMNGRMTKIRGILAEDGAEARFIRNVTYDCGMNPYTACSEDILELMDRNRELIDMCGSLGNLGDIYGALKDEDDEVDIMKLRFLLEPDDPDRVGCEAFHDSKGWHLCQKLDTLQDEEALCASGLEGELFADERLPREWYRVVFTTGDAEKMKEALTFMWDHYSGGEQVFSFPLSDRARAESFEPYNSLDVVTEPKGRKLTSAEEKHLKALKKHFGI